MALYRPFQDGNLKPTTEPGPVATPSRLSCRAAAIGLRKRRTSHGSARCSLTTATRRVRGSSVGRTVGHTCANPSRPSVSGPALAPTSSLRYGFCLGFGVMTVPDAISVPDIKGLPIFSGID